MEVLLIKDSKGKNHLVFNKEDINEYNEMGDKVSDFEILQVLGQGSFGFVAKVKSRLNHKIYAMKQIDFNTLNDHKLIELSENETKLLSKLNHPLITKYYKSIKERQILYIIMEFMDNGDLGGLLKAHQTIGKPIEEERLYDFFIQAMKSLTFIHSKKLCHRDIKPDNLFITIENVVKLGDFGVSATIVDKNEKNKNYKYLNEYSNNSIKDSVIGDVLCGQTVVGTPPFMSPEMIYELEYDLKTDVYSMGVTFFELCFWHLPRVPSFSFNGDIKLLDVPIKNNNNAYSNELKAIIYKMIEMEKNKRPDSASVLKMLTYEFNKKYSKNSSIGSLLCCLYAFEEFTEYLTRPNQQKYINQYASNKPITFAYLYGINSISNSVNEEWNNSLCEIRKVLTTENNKFDGNKEMETCEILNFLLGKMHKELNQINNVIKFNKGESYEIESYNKNEAIIKFSNASKQKNKSAVFDYFFGIMKTKSICLKCETPQFSFNHFYFVSFNLHLVERTNKFNNLSIEKLFEIQNNICIKIDVNKYRICHKCKSVQVHYQRKQFFCYPHFLIISLERGNNCQIKNKIKYDLFLNLEKQCEMNKNKYKLVGIIKRLDKDGKEHYISLYFDYKIKSWILRDDSKIIKINSPFEHNQGIEVMFFFKEIVNNNLSKKNSNGSIEGFYD